MCMRVLIPWQPGCAGSHVWGSPSSVSAVHHPSLLKASLDYHKEGADTWGSCGLFRAESTSCLLPCFKKTHVLLKICNLVTVVTQQSVNGRKVRNPSYLDELKVSVYISYLGDWNIFFCERIKLECIEIRWQRNRITIYAKKLHIQNT